MNCQTLFSAVWYILSQDLISAVPWRMWRIVSRNFYKWSSLLSCLSPYFWIAISCLQLITHAEAFPVDFWFSRGHQVETFTATLIFTYAAPNALQQISFAISFVCNFLITNNNMFLKVLHIISYEMWASTSLFDYSLFTTASNSCIILST